MRNRFVAQLGKTDLIEWHMREIEHLRASALFLAKHSVFVIFSGAHLDAVLGLQQQLFALAEDDRFLGTNRRARRLLPLSQTVFAEFALHDFRIEALPAELRNVVRAGDFAVTASHAVLAIPRDYASLRVLF